MELNPNSTIARMHLELIDNLSMERLFAEAICIEASKELQTWERVPSLSDIGNIVATLISRHDVTLSQLFIDGIETEMCKQFRA